MMLQCPICRNVMINNMMLGMHLVTSMMVGSVVILVICHRIVVVLCLRLLPLRVFFILHPAILEPYLNLPLGEVKISGQLPSLLLRHVSVEQELLLQLQGLVLRVRLTFFANSHLTSPLEGVGTGWTRYTHSHRTQGT